jgi:hypothetical protein
MDESIQLAALRQSIARLIRGDVVGMKRLRMRRSQMEVSLLLLFSVEKWTPEELSVLAVENIILNG